MRCPACHRRLPPQALCPVHAQRAPPAGPLDPEEALPPTVPGYPFSSLLGRGGFAWVFAARADDGREVALKLARARRDPRFAREAAALRRVGPPTVPALLEEGEVDGRPFLVMERLSGRTLASWLADLPGTGAAPIAEGARLFTSLARAVQHLHGAGLVHRDLKPENVFLRDEGGLALLDLGLARPGDGREPAPELTLTRTGQRLGTAEYMSPEQCAGASRVEAGADVYSLGVVLFELLTSRPPFVGDAAEVLRGHASLRPPRPSELNPTAAPLDALVLRCLSKEPAHRFADAGALLEAFRGATGQAAPAPAPAPPAAPAPASSRRPVALLGVTARAPLPELAAAMEPEGGSIARVHAELYVVAFPEHGSPTAGLKAALRAAGRWGRDRRVLHLAELRVRPGQTGIRLAGAALEQARDWWGAAPDEGRAWATPEAGAALDRDLAVHGHSGYRALLEDAAALAGDEELPPPPLLGREELVSGLARDAREALRQAEPTLVSLVAEAGLGRTRVLEALADALGRLPGLRVEPVRAESPRGDARGGVLAALLRVAGLALEEALSSVRELPSEAQRHALARFAGEALRRTAAQTPLVLLLDDAHWADAVALDALELATLAEAHAPLWLCLASRPELRGLRPALGDRAARRLELTLPPLSPEAARQLLLDRLRPVEYVPGAVLERLEAQARGVPLYLVERVRGLKRSGAVRRDPGSGAWSLAPDELPGLSAEPLFARLGEQVLSTLPANLRALAELCAVLGDEVTAEALASAQAHLAPEPELAPLASVDPGVGLARLVRAGLLRIGTDGRHGFEHPLMREALEAGIPPRRRRLLHLAALRALPEGGDGPALRRRAHHAAEAGEREVAFGAWLELAEQARRAHRAVEAEQDYSTALEQLPADEAARRQRVLAGRGMVRYRSHRLHEAREDLARAAALALARDDRLAAAELFLEEATLLDWMEDWEGSQALAERALELGRGTEDSRLAVRLTLAGGRLAVRNARWEEAARLLGQAAEEGLRLGEGEVRAVALGMLGAVLTLTDRLEEAEATFEAALAHCRATGDRLHLAMVYNNRCLLWQKRQAVDRAIEDLRLNRALARELGHAQIERWSTFNLGEFLHFLGRWEEALPLARRAHELGLRFFRELPVAVDALLLARIAAARGELGEAGRQLAWIDECCGQPLSPPSAVQRRMVRQVLAEAGGAFSATTWEALRVDARRDCTPDEQLEVLLQAAAQAARAGARREWERFLEEAGELAECAPMWGPRLQALRAR